MRKALALSLLTAMLGGCASDPVEQDISGTWINQAAIDAAAKSGNLREALLSYGPNLEWTVDTQGGKASFSNGFEKAEGQLQAEEDGAWRVDFYGGSSSRLSQVGKTLVQRSSENEPEQPFARSTLNLPAQAPIGSSFEQSLYAAYLGGQWKISEGPGAGGQVSFLADGRLEGLPGNDRYALCLAGDCASMSGENDSIWLQQGNQGSAWLFKRQGNQLEIFQALNSALADEMPQFYPGPRQWLLEK